MALSLFAPTATRTFTYYDRCAIALDSDEMKAVRLRIKLQILATPLSRSQNLRYPYAKEFYGYMQTFFQNVYVGEAAIHYSESYVYDYWNQHAHLANQLAIYIQSSLPGIDALHRLVAAQVFPEGIDIIQELVQSLTLTRMMADGFITDLPLGIILSDGGTSYINTFGSPINLLRFRFDLGTVFKVSLDRWSLPLSESGTSPGNPEVALPYDESNPNGNPPAPTGDRDPNGLPYGANAPPQSPIDPNLDPDDFSDPPDPAPGGGGTVSLQGWQINGIPGIQSAGFAVGCPAATLAISIPGLGSAVDPINLGVKQFVVDAQGRVLGSAVLSAFPGFVFGAHIFAADTSCGVNGLI